MRVSKYLVLGAGIQGSATAYDLKTLGKNVTEIVICDIDRNRLKEVSMWLKSDIVRTEIVNAGKKAELNKIIERHEPDIVISAVPWRISMTPIEACLEMGVSLLDYGVYQHPAFYEKADEIHKKSVDMRITIVPSCGVDPGLVNMLAGFGASKMDLVHQIRIYCGGIPAKEVIEEKKPPLGYRIVWSLEGVWTEYTGTCRIIEDREIKYVDAASGKEEYFFPGIGKLEAFYTDGLGTMLLSDVRETILKGVRSAFEKTLRWPGHINKINTLKECGLLDDKTLIDINGVKVTPRAIISKILEPKLKLQEDERDMTLVRVHVSGTIKRVYSRVEYTYTLIDYRDMKTGILSMARTTAFTGSIIAQLICNKEITEIGLLPPEKIGANKELFNKVLSEYAKRNIRIYEEKRVECEIS
ncbi:MAG: hypothetical protein DRO18_04525 [Thermoprotei archaeon]|nr:MAG: hypothetical protein DRO18_04525 [Thermoprotei archaeon]